LTLQKNTIKVYNGNIWYDVAGPKELLDHQHYAGEGLVQVMLTMVSMFQI
jgi:hypothetical protein